MTRKPTLFTSPLPRLAAAWLALAWSMAFFTWAAAKQNTSALQLVDAPCM